MTGPATHADPTQVERLARYIWRRKRRTDEDWARRLDTYREHARRILTTPDGWRGPRDYQTVPPSTHLHKARIRLDRLLAVGIAPEDLGVGRAKIPPIEQRAVYAKELALVLRDYERLLAGLLPPQDGHEDEPTPADFAAAEDEALDHAGGQREDPTPEEET